MTTPRILIIAGSDSGGGAGIQADIRTVTMLGGHAMTAITAITAQNTLGVQAVHPVPTEMVLAQIDSVVSDIGVDAIKIGMIGSAQTALAVAARLESIGAPVVLDPVMVATSGGVLADAATVESLHELMGWAYLTTPNLPELEALGGEAALTARGEMLLIKGGHVPGETIVDRLVGPEGEIARWEAPRIETQDTHGTGCTLASAIAVGLGQGLDLPEAIARARTFVRLALRDAPGFGGGHGPMGHPSVRLDLGGSPRFNQASVPVADYAASRDFYESLGFTLIVDSPGNAYARFETPGGATLSLHGDTPAIYFECDDLDARVAQLQSIGLVFDSEPVDQSWGWREAWLVDPAGNRLCLFSAGENRRYPPWRVAP
ncbi:bifunctional hydroxymethylpyrimidine kinase/phosphomethylpyrimidine kinase [Sphingobium nicotianae]|uniref:hydroxymethylpyrimidine kinase n=1 Tax=Sphingobium nicotianae TaxID=2782607 RepID=A0A9X1AK40_9SPHN|nr:bifunctional hydroxymethylpyrimidine kinase/phosphomethylpyrimidine kinase [Sphingobium nicotianae]MBT2185730.1 bifunctional hydroxymethylpyrimidine kinase/phosphomethylpyrimidine kinase [Sphingobium nicotianae]